MDELLKERLREVLFWAFLGVFVLSAGAAIFVFVVYQVNKPTAIPLLRELIISVVVQAAIGIVALWRNLFGLAVGAKPVPRADIAQGRRIRDNSEVLEPLLIDALSADISALRLGEAIRRIELVRRANPSLVSERILAAEIGVRGLLGHGPYILSRLVEIKDTKHKDILQFEPSLLSYATRDGELKAPRNLHTHDRSTQTLWRSLIAIDGISRGNVKVARLQFDLLDHNLDQDGRPMLNPYDRCLCYSSIPIAVTAAYFGEVKIVEGYLSLAKSLKQHSKEFGFADYPFVATIADIHQAFVRVTLGLGYDLSPALVRSIPGHAHVVARHCQVLAQNEQCLTTMEKLGAQYKKPIKAKDLRERLIQFEKFLRNNAVHVVGGTGGVAKLVER